MTMKKLLPLWALGLMLNHVSLAQNKWDLKRCVEYALNNNISVKQSDVQARLSALTYKQNKLSQIPTLNLGGNAGYSSGRNQDPTTFSLITTGYLSNGYTLQSGVNFFNFGSLRHTIEGSKFALDAANANTDKLRNDIALSVANAYLQFLLTNEQTKAAELKLHQSQAQLENTHRLVAAGTLPELNAAELESQVAQDSASYISAKASVDQAILTLKAYMSLDAAAPFELDTPPVENIPIENIADLQPHNVYTLALINQPLQKVDSLLIKSAVKYSAASKASMYPTFSLFGSLGTNYTNQTQEVIGTTILPNPTIGKVTVSGTEYNVVSLQPYSIYNFRKQPYFSQLDQNFRQSIGVSVNIPILSGGSLRTNYEKSKLNVKNYELQQQQDNLNLKQNIYQAFDLAVTALQKFEANKITVEATKRSFDYAQKRYNVGLLNTIDLLINQNNYYNAQINLLYSQFDYVFKMKVLEFYKGQGIKL